MLRWILFCFVFASCARQAEHFKAERSLLKENTKTLSSHLSGSDNSLDPRLRSMSLIIYPTAEDLQGFEYAPSEDVIGFWRAMEAHLPYGTRLPQHYTADMTDEEKLEGMATTVVTVAEMRTSAFRTKAPLQEQAEQMAEEIKLENRSLKDQIRVVSCYYAEESEDGTIECQSEQAEDNSLQQKSLRSCRNLENIHFTQDSLDPLVEGCQQLEQQREERSEILGRIEEQDDLRKTGESVLLELLLAAEEHSGDKVFLAVGGSKDRGGDEEKISRLVMDAGNSQISELALFLDFGLNYSSGTGSREYSTTNGKITGLRLEKRGWADILKFTLHTDDFDLHASLSMTVQELLDVRFVGDVRIDYPDGTGSTGVMSLELDRQ